MLAKKTTLVIILITATVYNAFSQTVSQRLNSFSPLALIYLKHLGLEDKNRNGTIEKSTGEGYEGFIAKYGNADVGFHANGIIQGANNGRLEEPEIINHYYTAIRFKQGFDKETSAIESEVTAYIYKNNLPLVWLDSERKIVMDTVTGILGVGWQNQPMTLTQAQEAFNKVLNTINRGEPINGRYGEPAEKGGYYTLPQFIQKREGFCFEAAQFGFWFFSQLKINSLMFTADLSPTTTHGVIIQTDVNNIIDYFGESRKYSDKNIFWSAVNPLVSLGCYYIMEYNINKRNLNALEKAIIYNKYDITNHAIMMKITQPGSPEQFQKIIAHGEFILENTDIGQIVSNGNGIAKNNLRLILVMLLVCYTENNKKTEADNMYALLNRYFSEDAFVQQFMEQYRSKQRTVKPFSP